MSPSRIWAIAVAFGGLMTVVGSSAMTFIGLWKSFPLGGLAMLLTAIALAMSFGVREEPQDKSTAEGERKR